MPSRTFALATVVAAFTGLLLAGWPSRAAESENPSLALFPFVLPWDDASTGATDLSGWLKKPAGGRGYVTVSKDGHFQVGRERIRFLGVNMSFAAGMPEKADGEKIAARMAKFGINVVRFHHMDTSAWPRGLRDRDAKTTGKLSSEALDRLDYFLAQLKSHGIYANLNLLVGRPFNAADGLPAEIEQLDWKDRHIIGFFDARQLALQKEFARALLTHTNVYTGQSYTAEPAVAFLEINNEQGLVHSWLDGAVDRLPDVFRIELRRQWNAWLRAKYSNGESLRNAWGAGAQSLGEEMLTNSGFTNGLGNWNLERHEGAQLEALPADDLPETLRIASSKIQSARLRVVKPGPEIWHVQLNQSGLRFERGKAYTYSFWAKTDRARRISLDAKQAHAPWQTLGLNADASVTKDWKFFRLVFNASDTDEQGRIGFSNLGNAGATLWLAGVSLRPGGVMGLEASESFVGDGLPCLDRASFGERTAAAQRDWMRFLSATEDGYWQTMYRCLKDELKVNALIGGTIVGCSTPNLMAKLDWVDTHSYWQHPRFPNRPWDAEDWIVENKTMVNERGGTLPGLALKRVAGKPHACTEYNHPAPNSYSSEGLLLLAAYAALQDWDAIYAYTYAHSRSEGWDTRKIMGFFDIDQHSAKMATLPAVAALFLRGDVQPARQSISVPLSLEQEADLLRNARAWSLVDGATVGIPREAVLMHRISVVADGSQMPSGTLPLSQFKLPDSRFESDTGELVWDLSENNRGLVTINSTRSKAVIGFGGGKRFPLGDFVIEPGTGKQNGWSAITLTALDRDAKSPRRWLLTATGYAENTGMGWKNAEKSSVGRAWGQAPSLVEGVAARISANRSTRLECWTLDERGQRGEKIAPAGNSFEIGPRWQTLWYELNVR